MEELCEQVAEVLRSLGLNALSWDAGGGMVGVGVAPGGTPPDELRFFFGTADSVWAGELLDEEGEVIGSLSTSVPSAEPHPAQIAAGIVQAIGKFAAAS